MPFLPATCHKIASRRSRLAIFLSFYQRGVCLETRENIKDLKVLNPILKKISRLRRAGGDTPPDPPGSYFSSSAQIFARVESVITIVRTTENLKKKLCTRQLNFRVQVLVLLIAILLLEIYLAPPNTQTKRRPVSLNVQ